MDETIVVTGSPFDEYLKGTVNSLSDVFYCGKYDLMKYKTNCVCLKYRI